MIKFPAIQTVEDLEAFEQSFSVSFDANELRAAIFHISDAYRSRAESPDLLEALADSAAHLAAAISLLERSPKVAAPSNKMFDQMLDDYRAALERAREAIARAEGLS